MKFQKILTSLSYNDLREIAELVKNELSLRENSYQSETTLRSDETIDQDYFDRFYPILGYENYQINRKGVIMKNGKIKPSHNVSKGEKYQKVRLTDNDGKSLNKYVHRLVALNFIPNPSNKKIVNHIDNTKDNNHINNLEWATESENMIHSAKMIKSAANDITQFASQCQA